jgi:AcrR family transcriptional regulator
MAVTMDDMGTVEVEPRRLRADAQRNRRRLLEAATELFSERGLEVGVADIAARAGVGRGTLFRNFPSKEHLIAAIVVERMHESIARAHEVLDAGDPGAALFELIDSAINRSLSDRALFDALSDTWLVNPEIRAAHAEMLTVLDRLVTRAQAAGAVRDDISAIDVVIMIKGVCEAARQFQHLGEQVTARQLDLVLAAISTNGADRKLRGRPPTAEDFERAMTCLATAAVSAPAASTRAE